MNRILLILLLAAACGGDVLNGVEESGLAVVAPVEPQSLTHGTLTPSRRSVAYSFDGEAGDAVAPDVWPLAQSPVTPTLALLGPKGHRGHRPLLATGRPRGTDERHPAIDGFRLPQTGNYLIVVGTVAGGRTGSFSLRLWMASSHLPRQETSQVDLGLKPSEAAVSMVRSHSGPQLPWTDADVEALVADMEQQVDPRVAISTAQYALSALHQQEATDGQRARARSAVAQLIGTPEHFATLDPQVQSLALWWLGNFEGLLFSSDDVPNGPDNVGATIAHLVAAWPGAKEDTAWRHVQAKVLDGKVYGWQADWQASWTDSDGTQVWLDYGREWFDASGRWLREQSPGASEPDDDG